MYMFLHILNKSARWLRIYVIVKKGFSKNPRSVLDQIYWTWFACPEPDPDQGFTESSSNHDPDPGQFFQFERIYSGNKLKPKNTIYFFL